MKYIPNEKTVPFEQFELVFFTVMGKDINSERIFSRFKFDYGYYNEGVSKRRIKGTLFYGNHIGQMDLLTSRKEGHNILNSQINTIVHKLFNHK